MLKFILLTTGLAFYNLKNLEFIYRFQIKEYRFDRLVSYMKEQGIARELFSIRFILPSKRARNSLVAIVLFAISITGSMVLYELPLLVLIGIVFLSPLLSFFTVSLLTAVINIPVFLYREHIILKAKNKLARINPYVIAISGSYGKSSVKELVYEVLKKDFIVAKTSKNMNSDIGVAISILKNVTENTEIFIAEMGAYKIGEVAKICRFVKPNAVIITAFGNQHLGLYGSKENLIRAESEPLAFLNDGDTAFISKDIPEFRSLSSGKPYKVVSWSQNHRNDFIYVADTTVSSSGTSATLYVKNKPFKLETQLLGLHAIFNLLPAIAIGLYKNIPIETILRMIKKIKPIDGKLSVHLGKHGNILINDANNSNVEGFIEAIRVTNMFDKKHKLILSKGIIELGKEKKRSYERIIKELRKTPLHLWTTDKDFVQISTNNIRYFKTEEDMFETLGNDMNKDFVVCFEGRFKKPIKHFILS